MPKLWYRLRQAVRLQRTALILNLAVILPFALLTFYIKLSTFLNGYSAGRTLRRSTGIDLLITMFSEPYTVPHEGILTEISEIVWCFPIALCCFTASLLSSKRLQKYLICLSVLLILLLMDDAFRVTIILKNLTGMPKLTTYGLYASMGLAIALYFYRTILNTPYHWLFLAAGLMGLSVVADVSNIPGIGTPIVLEDGTKLLGLVNLTIYIWRLARINLRQATYQSMQ